MVLCNISICLVTCFLLIHKQCPLRSTTTSTPSEGLQFHHYKISLVIFNQGFVVLIFGVLDVEYGFDVRGIVSDEVIVNPIVTSTKQDSIPTLAKKSQTCISFFSSWRSNLQKIMLATWTLLVILSTLIHYTSLRSGISSARHWIWRQDAHKNGTNGDEASDAAGLKICQAEIALTARLRRLQAQ